MEINITNLSKKFGSKEALKNVSLDINEGMFGLLGRNGAGKTTLMRILSTLLTKSSGDVKVCGVDISNGKKIRGMVGYLPQDFSVYPNLTVYEAMDYLAVLSGISKSERKKIIPELLQKVNLQECHNVKIKALSGGMKRRLGIAQAIMHDPKVLIVDEPTAGLDPEERIRFRNLLCEIAKGRIVLLSTHIVGDIEATCENIAVLESGSILYKGTVKDLLNMASGKVFTMEIKENELDKIKEKYKVTGMLNLGDKVTVRALAETKPQGAKVCEPNVEDAYMLLMGGNPNV